MGKSRWFPGRRTLLLVDVEILVTESSASKLKKLKEDISIDFTGTKSYIIVKIEIQE